MLADIDIKIITKGPEKDLAQLYREAGWLTPSESDDLAFLKTVIQNSAGPFRICQAMLTFKTLPF